MAEVIIDSKSEIYSLTKGGLWGKSRVNNGSGLSTHLEPGLQGYKYLYLIRPITRRNVCWPDRAFEPLVVHMHHFWHVAALIPYLQKLQGAQSRALGLRTRSKSLSFALLFALLLYQLYLRHAGCGALLK